VKCPVDHFYELRDEAGWVGKFRFDLGAGLNKLEINGPLLGFRFLN
jgi:hypothetical protein